MTGSNQSSDYNSESFKFLENDFNQCFQQMRHYDSQIADLLKFIFTGYTTLIGLGVGLYEFGIEKDINFAGAVVAASLVGLIIGLSIFRIIIRNRIYFVRVARYVNEIRDFYFKYKPEVFKNKSRMYTDYSKPSYFNWYSSQSWLSYISAVLNSVLLAIAIYVICPGDWVALMVLACILFVLQIAFAIVYLFINERK